MKSSDLERAIAIRAELEGNRRIRARLAGGEALRLMLGEGQGAAAIHISSAWLEDLRADLVAGLDRLIADGEAALRALGVEP